jgi:hypothetical protein
VLANEQVIDGKGWRSGAPVERKRLNQWFLKITDFAEELLEGLGSLDQWPEKVRIMQSNWIGRSEGLQFRFRLADAVAGIEEIEVFTTRPDTLFGASFLAIAPDHPIAAAVAEGDPEAAKFVAECKAGGTSAADLETMEKKGFKTALEAVHPFDPQWRLPVYIANFVLMDYGTGALFGVPGHDQRDFEFAKRYQLSIRRVVAESPKLASEPIGTEAEMNPGVAVNSQFLDGLSTAEATAEVIRRAEVAGWGEGRVQYRLRDWGVSRQRYWGTPKTRRTALRPRPARFSASAFPPVREFAWTRAWRSPQAAQGVAGRGRQLGGQGRPGHARSGERDRRRLRLQHCLHGDRGPVGGGRHPGRLLPGLAGAAAADARPRPRLTSGRAVSRVVCCDGGKAPLTRRLIHQ